MCIFIATITFASTKKNKTMKTLEQQIKDYHRVVLNMIGHKKMGFWGRIPFLYTRRKAYNILMRMPVDEIPLGLQETFREADQLFNEN